MRQSVVVVEAECAPDFLVAVRRGVAPRLLDGEEVLGSQRLIVDRGVCKEGLHGFPEILERFGFDFDQLQPDQGFGSCLDGCGFMFVARHRVPPYLKILRQWDKTWRAGEIMLELYKQAPLTVWRPSRPRGGL